ncbi:hypothetical protein LguiA_016056 [Lonicera macranthoides]
MENFGGASSGSSTASTAAVSSHTQYDNTPLQGCSIDYYIYLFDAILSLVDMTCLF